MADKDVKYYDGDSWQSITELTASKVEAKLPIKSEDNTVVLSDSSGTFVVSTGNPSVTRLTVADDAVNSSVAIQAPSISGLNSNDASVTLGATVTIDADQYTPLNLTNNKDGLLIRTTNKNGRQYWHGQDATGWAVCTPQVVGGVAQAVRSFGAVSDDPTPDWRVYSGGFQADYFVETPSISGLNSNDASVTLGATCNVDAASGLVVKTSGHSTARLYVQDNYAQFNGPLWVKSGTAAAPGIRCSNEKTGLCIGENSTNIISASLNGTTYMSLQPNENSFIKVAKVTGSKDPDNDASVTLGGQAALTKGDGSEYVVTDSASIATKKYIDERTTADIPLDDPVDTLTATRATLTTQKDANQHFNEEIQKRAIVVTLSQVDYDAIPPDEIDDSTLYLITG